MRRTPWVVLIAVLALTGCASGGPPTQAASGSATSEASSSAASSAPAGSASPSVDPLAADVVYLALGDSNVYGAPDDCGSCTTYPYRVQTELAASSGRTVGLLDGSQHNRLTTFTLLEELQSDVWQDPADYPNRIANLTPRKAVAAADIITITVSANTIPWYQDPDSCGADYDATCIKEVEKPFATSLGKVLAEIKAIRAGKPTAVRVTTFHNDLLKGPDYDPTQFFTAEQVARGSNQARTFLDVWNGDICAAAKRYGGLCADTYHAINGENGRTPLGKGYFHMDAGDLNQGGQDRFAEVILETGFAPLELKS